jgi:hypothetical protein
MYMHGPYITNMFMQLRYLGATVTTACYCYCRCGDYSELFREQNGFEPLLRSLGLGLIDRLRGVSSSISILQGRTGRAALVVLAVGGCDGVATGRGRAERVLERRVAFMRRVRGCSVQCMCMNELV